MPTTEITNGKSIAELDAIIHEAVNAKQALYDARINDVLARIEQDCDELSITPKQLLALFNKTRKRKARPRKDDASSDNAD